VFELLADDRATYFFLIESSLHSDSLSILGCLLHVGFVIASREPIFDHFKLEVNLLIFVVEELHTPNMRGPNNNGFC
jgi:hypothetical protein